MTLSSQLTSDITKFIETDEFAVSVKVHPRTDKEATVSIIFDEEYFDISVGEVGHSGSQPMALMSSTDVVNNSIDVNTIIEINSADYKVVEPQPDGTGLTMLIMEAQ